MDWGESQGRGEKNAFSLKVEKANTQSKGILSLKLVVSMSEWMAKFSFSARKTWFQGSFW